MGACRGRMKRIIHYPFALPVAGPARPHRRRSARDRVHRHRFRFSGLPARPGARVDE
jgi:hypothetical protein